MVWEPVIGLEIHVQLRTATKMFMTLARRDGVWSIEAIRHEAAQ